MPHDKLNKKLFVGDKVIIDNDPLFRLGQITRVDALECTCVCHVKHEEENMLIPTNKLTKLAVA